MATNVKVHYRHQLECERVIQDLKSEKRDVTEVITEHPQYRRPRPLNSMTSLQINAEVLHTEEQQERKEVGQFNLLQTGKTLPSNYR